MRHAASRHESVCRCVVLAGPSEVVVKGQLARQPTDPPGVDVEHEGGQAPVAGDHQQQLWRHHPVGPQEPTGGQCGRMLQSGLRTISPRTCAVEARVRRYDLA